MIEKYFLYFENGIYNGENLEYNSKKYSNLKELFEDYSDVLEKKYDKIELLKEVTTEYGTRVVPVFGSLKSYIEEYCPEILF